MITIPDQLITISGIRTDPMYSERMCIQSAAEGTAGAILDGLSLLRSAVESEHFTAAVAYATRRGSDLLASALESDRWESSSKRWLVSVDFGRTEPAALEFLASLPGSDVRVPHGTEVVDRPGFTPRVVFHPKIYLVGRLNPPNPFIAASFLGSANLTESGLVAGTEVGVLQQWSPPVSARERRSMSAIEACLHWFEHAWHSASPLDAVLPLYAERWRAAARASGEDDAAAPVAHRAVGAAPIGDGLAAVRLAAARGFWIEAGRLYKNRGPTEAGNQLDLPRGSRVFFGFSAEEVDPNTQFGEIVVKCEGFRPARRTMRFGNNMMDKLNLPIPGRDGPGTYDGRVLLFERLGTDAHGRRKYLLRVGTRSDLRRWSRDAQNREEGQMHGGRRYGLLF